MKKTISIIGGGPAALMLASFLDSAKFEICVYEKNESLARKFLVAGKGGFNLTHSEPLDEFINRYTPPEFLKEALCSFSNVELQNWLAEIGIPTYVGSSKRVYPKEGIKPIEVLEAMINKLKENGVAIQYNYAWQGWSKTEELLFSNGQFLKSDITVFALGGASWKVTGSDGVWLGLFKEKGIETYPFQPSNCAYEINWEKEFIGKHEGAPLKNITLRCNETNKPGEVVITKFGLEGNAIYALSPQLREQFNKNQTSLVFLDLKPYNTSQELLLKLEQSDLKSTSETLRKYLNLTSAQIALLKSHTPKETFMNFSLLSESIKNIPLHITGAAPIDNAISTAGGVALNAVDKNFQLKLIPGTFCIGEMLDWDAPTGGYLLQACFSMGKQLALHLNTKDNSSHSF